MNILKSGTTIVGLVSQEKVIVGCDSQATLGSFAEEIETKWYTLTPHCMLALCGSAEVCRHLAKQITLKIKYFDRLYGITLSKNGLENIISQLLKSDPLHKASPHGISIAGFCSILNIPYILSFDGIGFPLTVRALAQGSGSLLAKGLIHEMDNRQGGIPEIDYCLDVIKKALNLAKKHDAFSGYTSHIYSISKKGIAKITL